MDESSWNVKNSPIGLMYSCSALMCLLLSVLFSLNSHADLICTATLPSASANTLTTQTPNAMFTPGESLPDTDCLVSTWPPPASSDQAINWQPIDTRSAADRRSLHLPETLAVDPSILHLKPFLRHRPLLLIGNGFDRDRLLEACQRLRDKGMTVAVLAGGLRAWQQQGGAVQGDPLALPRLPLISPADYHAERHALDWHFIEIPAALLPLERRDWLVRVHRDAPITGRTLLVAPHGALTGWDLRILKKWKRPDVVYLEGGRAGYEQFLRRQQAIVQRPLHKVGTSQTCGQAP